MTVEIIDFQPYLCYTVCSVRVPNTLLDAQYTGIFSQDSAQLIHHTAFVFHERMDISVESHDSIFVTENFGQRLDIHPAFNRPGRKRMTDRMKAAVRNPVFL